MKFNRIILINQYVGQLFYQLSLGLSIKYKNGGLLIAGNICDRNIEEELKSKLIYKKSIPYSRKRNSSRIISWVNYTLHITGYLLFSKKDDLILITSNPPIVHFWIYFISKFRKLSYVLLIYDIYPNVLINSGILRKNNPFIILWKILNKIIYSKALKIITLGENMRNTISNDFDIKNSKIFISNPWVDVNFIKPILKKDNQFAQKYIGINQFIILYSGNMGITHDMESILEAATILQKYQNILFLFIGGGEKFSYVKDFIDKNNLINAKILKYQPEEILPYTLSLADISIVSIRQSNENLLLPSKICYYLSAGSALIGICNSKSELAKIIEKNQIGFILKSNQPQKLAKLILTLYHDKYKLDIFKNNARQVAINQFDKKKGIKNFYNFLKDL
tara:strand:+ start:1319 stop:2497 length:1179 start_codon:yes stop_codon:yes gene_type:complete